MKQTNSNLTEKSVHLRNRENNLAQKKLSESQKLKAPLTNLCVALVIVGKRGKEEINGKKRKS